MMMIKYVGTHLLGQQTVGTVFEKALVPSVCQSSDSSGRDSE